MNFKRLSILNRSCSRALDPIVFLGLKVTTIPMTVASSYGVLYMFKLAQDAPLLYGIYIVTFVAAMTFQMVWYQTSMALDSPAIAVHRYFIIMNWSRGGPHRFRKLHRDLPGKHGGPFSVFKQWKPQVFLRKIFVSTMKIHFYVRK